MKTHTCAGLSAFVGFTVALLLLQVEYPWSTYAAYDFSKGITFISYMLAALVVAAVAATATVLCLRAFRGSRLLGAVMCCAAMVVSLSMIAFLLGPAGLDVPGTRLNGIFFSELDSSILSLWSRRRRRLSAALSAIGWRARMRIGAVRITKGRCIHFVPNQFLRTITVHF